MNTGLMARMAVPASLMSWRIGLCLRFFSISRRRTAISPPARARDRVVMGGRHLAACHLDPPLVQGAEFLDPLLDESARRIRQVPMVAEDIADERLVIRDLELVHRRIAGDPTFLDAETIAPRPAPPVVAVASGSRSISRAIRDAPASDRKPGEQFDRSARRSGSRSRMRRAIELDGTRKS